MAIDRLGGKTCYHSPRAVLSHEIRPGEYEAVAARILLDSAFKLLRRCVLSGVSRSVTIDSGRNKGREASSLSTVPESLLFAFTRCDWFTDIFLTHTGRHWSGVAHM